MKEINKTEIITDLWLPDDITDDDCLKIACQTVPKIDLEIVPIIDLKIVPEIVLEIVTEIAFKAAGMIKQQDYYYF